MDPESPETCPRLVPGLVIRHRGLPHPILRTTSGLFPRTRRLRLLEVVHLEERMAIGHRTFARERDGWDRSSTEHIIRRIRSELLQSLPSPIGFAFPRFIFCTTYFADLQWCCSLVPNVLYYYTKSYWLCKPHLTSNTIRDHDLRLREAASYHSSPEAPQPAGDCAWHLNPFSHDDVTSLLMHALFPCFPCCNQRWGDGRYWRW
jgi:hypothetical protein